MPIVQISKSIRRILFYWSLLLGSLIVPHPAGTEPVIQAGQMVEPGLDDLTRPWCYLSKSTTVLASLGHDDVSQVTFDGAIYTGHAELCFFYGDSLTPLMARQKEFLEGWIPIITYTWQEGGLRYHIEMFAAGLTGEPDSLLLNWVKLSVKNIGNHPRRATLAAAVRHNGEDHRGPFWTSHTDFQSDWMYEMTDSMVVRDGKLVYEFSPGAERWAVPDQPYTEPFIGAAQYVTPRAEVCLARYQWWELQSGREAHATFVMPREPQPLSRTDVIQAIQNKDYESERAHTIAFWRTLMDRATSFEIPEPIVQRAWRQSLVHLMLAMRYREGKWVQTSAAILYPNFFMIDFVDIRKAYALYGLSDIVERTYVQIFDRQEEDGLFCDTSLSHGKRLWSSHGHVLHTLAHHFTITQDREYAERVYPRLKRGVEWLIRAVENDPKGIMPPAWPYDAEMIEGYYTSHNLWSILGMRSAIAMARALGKEKDAANWLRFHDEYLKNFMNALHAVAGKDRAIPTGLYDFKTGPAMNPSFPEWNSNQDWENLLGCYPNEVLQPMDPRLTATLEKMHREKYREGIMTYRNGMHLHQYLTTNVSNQHVIRGEQQQALIDLYHILLHCGSTGEGFENMVEPWGARDATTFVTPHTWAAAKIALLIRNMLVLERDGQAGLEPDQRDLHLFSVISPAWAIPGKSIVIRNAVTDMGLVSAEMHFTTGGARITIQNDFHHHPRNIILHIPYFVKLNDYETDAAHVRHDGNWLRLSPDVTEVELIWDVVESRGLFEELLKMYRSEYAQRMVDDRQEIEPGQEFLLEDEKNNFPELLNFELIRDAYLHEYARRYQEYRAAGKEPMPVQAPPILSREERERAFTATYHEK